MPDVPALVALAEAGDFAPLVALARDGTDGQKEAAAWALGNLAEKQSNLKAMKRLGYGKRSGRFGWEIPYRGRYGISHPFFR